MFVCMYVCMYVYVYTYIYNKHYIIYRAQIVLLEKSRGYISDINYELLSHNPFNSNLQSPKDEKVRFYIYPPILT